MLKNKSNRKKSNPFKNAALLLTANDTTEADIIESKLNAFGIPSIRRHRGTGAYLTIIFGKSNFGVDIYVPEDRLNEAKDIIESTNDIGDEEILNDPSFYDESLKEAHEEYIKKLDRRNWLMAGLLFLAFVLLLILWLVK